MSKVKNIIDGWGNYLTSLNDSEKATAQARVDICARCPNAAISTFWQVLPQRGIVNAEGLKCELCGCPIITKAMSFTDTCPDNPPRWPKL